MQDMVRSLRLLFVLLFIGVSSSVHAQNGVIAGTITDEKKQSVIGAVVQAYLGGSIASGGAVTDYDGNYTIKPLSAGRYTVKIFYTGYDTISITQVVVSGDKTTEVSAQIKPKTTTLGEVTVTAYKQPLIDKYADGGHNIVTSEQIQKLAVQTTNDVVSQTASVYQQKSGACISIGGARTGGTKYFIDGVLVTGTAFVSPSRNSVDQIEVITSGLSARYGDASGGVVNITTKGVTNELRGNLVAEHSVDGYNHNYLSGIISGPLLRKKGAEGKKPIVGFQLSGDYSNDDDNNPNYNKVTVLKGDVLKKLQDNPLVRINSSGSTVNAYSSEFITDKDLTTQKMRPNANATTASLGGKFDFQIADNLKLTAGGSFNYSSTHEYSRGNSIYAPSASPNLLRYSGRGYIKLTQRFGKNGATEKETGPISNAFYTLQADFQRDFAQRQDPTFKHDIFKYYYVGKFDQKYSKVYGPARDDSSGLIGIKLLLLDNPTSVTYTRSELNPVLANYTSNSFDLLGTGSGLSNINSVRGNLGLLNGDAPNYVYGMYNNIGSTLGYYSLSKNDAYSFSVDASFDLKIGKTSHAIGFGLYYQQQILRSYYAQSNLGGANSLWSVMRLLVNRQFVGLDTKNPTFIVNGKTYTLDDYKNHRVAPGPSDTILYTRLIDTKQQATFDKNLRKKMGYADDYYINVDNIDPNNLSLNLFSPDELLNLSGTSFVGYNGYNAYGEEVTGQVNFNDFFTKKDASGNFARPIGAFRPNYTAGYIQDQFQFKDILFNIGVRVDRYDANTKVLKDPYSLYALYTVGDLKGNTKVINKFNNGVTPSNIGNGAAVYIDDNASSTPQIIGYRQGDDWYDPYGRFIEDPRTLKTYSGGRDPQPYLQDRFVRINSDSTSFDPNKSFTDYTPQINVMPRISFTFPISTVAKFYAHYDVVVQRPPTNFATPYDYYTLPQNAQKTIIDNNDLKPEKTFDYEVGFQQVLSKNSSLKLAAFYKERKDQIQVRTYINAWPQTYTTYGNRDFSSTKGMTATYDLRRLGNIRMNIAYTLQFASGTGSSSTSTNGGSSSSPSSGGLLSTFNAAGLPNLRFATSLDYDARHSLVASIDYRYDEGEGPVVGGKHILQNFGINLLFRARSGEPYTKLDAAVNTVANGKVGVVDGEINTSRLPWHYGMDIRIDKDFSLALSKKSATNPARKDKELGINAFISITNLLNNKDILSVYGFTGRADDNGFLTSSLGISTAAQQTNPATYNALYMINQNNPDNYNLPRRINLGLQFNF